MAFINTGDAFVRDYCETHKQAGVLLDELVALQNAHFYKYGVPEKGGIDKIQNGINSKDWFKQVKSVQIDLLKELKRVCDENGLKLFLVYGSLLGAVRSGGMIDGDDDIDVALIRDDYDKLISLTDSFQSPYFLQNNYNDDCFYGGYIKLRNTQTTAINPQNWWVNCCEGISIDIFPIDSGYSSTWKEYFKIKKIHHLQRLLFAKSYGFFRNFRDMPLFVWKAYKYFGKLFPRRKLIEMLDSAMKSNDENSCRDKNNMKLGIYAHYSKNSLPRYFPVSAFENFCKMTYEGLSLFAPSDWDDVLYKIYGHGYLIPSNPIKELHAFYKADVPYENYKKRFTQLFTSVPDKNKKIIMVGDKDLFTEYSKRFKSASYEPDLCIDIKNISELKNCAISDTYLIIAAFDFLKIEKNIREMGFRDYSIYVYDRGWLLLSDLKYSEILYNTSKI